MKKLLFLSIVAGFALSGCYTQLATYDYDDEYSYDNKVREEQNYESEEIQDSLSYQNEEDYTSNEEGAIINNYYFNDFPVYRRYYWGYYPTSYFYFGFGYYDPWFDPYWFPGTCLVSTYYYPYYWDYYAYYYPSYDYNYYSYKYRTHLSKLRNNDGSRGNLVGTRNAFGDRASIGRNSDYDRNASNRIGINRSSGVGVDLRNTAIRNPSPGSTESRISKRPDGNIYTQDNKKVRKDDRRKNDEQIIKGRESISNDEIDNVKPTVRENNSSRESRKNTNEIYKVPYRKEKSTEKERVYSPPSSREYYAPRSSERSRTESYSSPRSSSSRGSGSSSSSSSRNSSSSRSGKSRR